MRFELMKTREQFENLREGDKILVKWSERYIANTPGLTETIMFYRISKILESDHDIICNTKYNHYFNWNCILENRSVALEVYRIMEE